MASHLEHKILAEFKEHLAPRGPWLVAVSGGLDSVVLTDVLHKWRRHLGARLILAHVHHGAGEARDHARAFVRELARQKRARFVTNRHLPEGLRSEAEWRTFRHACLQRWAREEGGVPILLAHHQDDLLETRLIRLIRGTGPAGLRAMAPRSGRLFRPLLKVSRAALETYAREQKLTWVEDPTNATVEPLRNWIRLAWLPELERRRPGASRALARSLEQLAPKESGAKLLAANVGLRRETLIKLSSSERAALLAEYLFGLGARDFGASHVVEVSKRLRSRRRSFTFTVRGCCFHVTPDLVWASRVCDRADSVLS